VALTWNEPSEIAWALMDAYPEQDPLDLNFVDLHQMIVGLEEFADDPDAAGEPVLEAVVVAWNDQR
jgi:FeS assembly protein IscX